jgi:hypothetical protein
LGSIPKANYLETIVSRFRGAVMRAIKIGDIAVAEQDVDATCRQAAQEVYELRALKAEVVAGKMRRKALKKKPLYTKYRSYFEGGPEDSSLAAMAEEIARDLASEQDGRKN